MIYYDIPKKIRELNASIGQKVAEGTTVFRSLRSGPDLNGLEKPDPNEFRPKVDFLCLFLTATTVICSGVKKDRESDLDIVSKPDP
jgi:hypothetical protein